jgi:hypothetical protein
MIDVSFGGGPGRSRAARLVHDRKLQRMLVRVRRVLLDGAGNARSAEIHHAEGNGREAGWIAWRAGDRKCLNDFRIELVESKRAGLHFRIGVPDDSQGFDASGYRIAPPRFIATSKVSREGTLLLVPCDPVDPAVWLDGEGEAEDQGESDLMRELLVVRYGADPEDAEAMMRGFGPEIALPEGSYANRFWPQSPLPGMRAPEAIPDRRTAS